MKTTSSMNIPPVKVCFSENDIKEILARAEQCLSSGRLSLGENVNEFEEMFAQYVGCKHAVSVNSGGSAIQAVMEILGVKDRDVLTPTNTFIATAAGVIRAGGRVKFVDTEAQTFSVSIGDLERSLTETTAGVIVVHIGGIITPQIEDIRAWCDGHGLWLFEDAAHAHGSRMNGKMAGKFGVAAAYSFFVTKVMTSGGEGGMVVTDDDDLAEKVRILRNYGKPEPWVSYHTHIGSWWRMSEIQAAIGCVQLKKLDTFILWREHIADLYTRQLRQIPDLTLVLPRDRSSWYKYIVLLPDQIDRKKLKEKMREHGVNLSGGVYDIPLHQQPVFSSIEGDFPVAEDICSRHICLPIYYEMTEDEASYVVKVLAKSISDPAVLTRCADHP